MYHLPSALVQQLDEELARIKEHSSEVSRLLLRARSECARLEASQKRLDATQMHLEALRREVQRQALPVVPA